MKEHTEEVRPCAYAHCSAQFVWTSRCPQQRYCTKRCGIRSRSSAHGKRRRAAKAGVAHEHIELIVLAERDGWRCHLCRRKVSLRTWSMDHLIPLSQGGAHVYENVALAHRRCNAKRGVRGPAQLRLEAADLDHGFRERGTCEICTSPFMHELSTQKYCGPVCAREGKRRYNSARYHAFTLDEKREKRPLKGPPARICPVCESHFCWPGMSNRRLYCTPGCAKTAKRQRINAKQVSRVLPS